MNQSVFIALVNNAALLLALAVVYELTYLLPVRSDKIRQVISGILISIICILIMKIPLALQPGLMIDTRSILISTSALFFGPVPTGITVIFAAAFRLYSGGIGTIPGLGIIVTSALIGSAWRLILYPKSKKWNWLNVYIMSLAVHASMLICMFMLPYPESISVLRDIGIPVLIIYPVVSILLCLLLLRQQEVRAYQLQLKQSEERFQMLFNHAPMGYQSLDADGCFLNVNQQWLDILGYTSEEVIGRWFGDFLSSDSRELFQRQFPVFKARGYAQTELILIHKSGRQMYISFEGKIGYDLDGAFQQTHCILQDITELKMKEAALTNSELKYHRLFETMKDGVLIVEADSGLITDVNPYLLQFSGYSDDFFVGRKIWDLGLFQEMSASRIEVYLLKDGQHLSFDNSGFFTLSGAYRNVEIVVSAYYVKDQKMLQVNIRDTTDRKQIETALIESQKKYSSYIENAPDGIVVIDERGRFLEVNRAASGMTGYSREQMLNMHFNDIIHRESICRSKSSLNKLLRTGIMNTELKYTKKNGIERWMAADAIKLTKNRYLCFSRNITERKRAEEELLYLSNHDYLTGLYNRRFYEHEIKRIDTCDNLPLSVITCDINGLKFINEIFGEKEGDRILIQAARIIRAELDDEAVAARTGGDEFDILLPRTEFDVASKVVEEIRKTCNTYNKGIENEAFHINLSLGIATKIRPEEDIGRILKRAGDQMYQSKLLVKKSSHSAILESIKATMLEKSHETEAHAERLVAMSRKIGKRLKLNQSDMDHLVLLATLHDIGKVGIPDNILNKPDRLSEDEWIEMRKHPEIGYRIAVSSADLASIAEYILCHHERWDGNGYPQQISGSDIPLLSRIISVVDAYDAMTQDRPYRKAMDQQASIREIVQNAGTQFDPHVVSIFTEIAGCSDSIPM